MSYGFLISAQEGFNSTTNVLPDSDNSVAAEGNDTFSNDPNNLTGQVAQKLSALATSSDPDEQQISVDKMQSIITDSISQKFSESDLPTISPDEIKIKKQNYTGTAEQIKAKKKEDFTNYMIAVYYIMSSSSPKPITSGDDLNGMASYFTQSIDAALNSRDSSQLAEISQSGQKILDQLRTVEVPEDVLEIHTKALQFAKYAIALKPTISANTEDPLTDLVNISKLASFMESLISFSEEASGKFSEYGLTYDDAIKGKLNALGITPPEIDDSTNTTINPSTPSSATILKR